MIKFKLRTGLISSAITIALVIATLFIAFKVDELKNTPTTNSGSNLSINSSNSFSSKNLDVEKSFIVLENQSIIPRNVTNIFQFLKNRGFVKTISLNGNFTSGEIEITATTKNSNEYSHDPFIAFALIVLDSNGNEILNGNYIDAEWIGDERKMLSVSKSNGLLLPDEKKTYKYDLKKIPTSLNFDQNENIFPSGLSYFNLFEKIQSPNSVKIAIFPSQKDFGVIESVKLNLMGTGTLLIK